MMPVRLYQVGGSVRDELLGLKSKDIDFAVECVGFDELFVWLDQNGFDIFLSQPEYMTIRARFPKGGFEFAGQNMSGVTADFVVCRTEAHYSDARHPDNVGVGTIEDDLARRDFTMNAIAKRADGTLLDPYNGVGDAYSGVIRAVGDPLDRLTEDPLRALRALRFAVTKNMQLSMPLALTLEDATIVEMLRRSVSQERIREELFKMFKADTYKTMETFVRGFPDLGRAVLQDTQLWVKPTLEER